MVSKQTTRLWAMANDKREFERMRNLFNGELKSVLDNEKISTALRSKAVTVLGGEEIVYALHDPCDIRKPEAEKLENIGIVRDLKGKLINGYSTLNTVCVAVNGKKLQLGDITVFSNRDKEKFVSQKELNALARKQDQATKKDKPGELSEREKDILKLIEAEEVVNINRVTRTQLRKLSQQMKASHKQLKMWHVLDRQFDGVSLFKFIDEELHDLFTIRLKVSRNSDLVQVNEEGKELAIKLKDVEMASTHTDVLDKVRLNKHVYQQAKRVIEWGTLLLAGCTYSVVRITLFTRDGKEIFPQPMLLITNYSLNTPLQALTVYRTYLMRAKIEGVFKFVKNALGWEEFQVRDWESIKNLIALAFFVGGYFYEIEPELAHHPVIEWLCELGGGKGQLTRHYFLEGLQCLLIHQQVEKFREQTRLRSPTWDSILEFAL